MQKKVFSFLTKKRVLFGINIIVGFCISMCIVHYMPRLWENYLSKSQFNSIIEPIYIYWKNTQLVKIGSFFVLAMGLSYIGFLFSSSRFVGHEKQNSKWLSVIYYVVIAGITFLLINQMNIPMPPGQKRIEIIPVSSGVGLVEMKIDGVVVDPGLFDKGEAWIEQDEILLYAGEGNAPLTYGFKNETNNPMELLFLEGKGAGSAIIKINGHDKGLYEFASDDEGEFIVEVLPESILIMGLLYLLYGISIFSIIFVISKISAYYFRNHALFFSFIYLVILFTIKTLNVPENHFDTDGFLLPVYSFVRCIFMVYLAAMFYAAGKLVFRLVKNPILVKDRLDLIILNFFIGSSFFNLFLILLGIVKGYYFWVALIISLPLVYFSYQDIAELFLNIRKRFSAWFSRFCDWFHGSETPISTTQLFLGLLILTASIEAVFLLFVHGLSPDLDLHTSGDVARHYIPYYQAVIDSHGNFLNTVWYHYFYTRYDGLFFFSNMLSDVYGAQLVSYIYVILTAVILYSFIKRISKSHLLRWFILCQYFSVIWSSDVAFSKLHIIEMGGLAFSMWVAVKLYFREYENGRLFSLLCGIALVGLVIFSPKNMIFVIPFFFVVTTWFLVRRKKEEWKIAFVIFSLLSLSLLGVLLNNYLVTGMFEDTPIKTMWNLADQERFSQWVSPYYVLYFIEGYRFSDSLGSIGINDLSSDYYIRAFHLDKILFFSPSWYWDTNDWVLFFFILLVMIISAVIGYKKYKHKIDGKGFMLFSSSIVILTGIILSVVLGRWSSLERTLILVVFFMLVMFVSLWEMGVGEILRQKSLGRVFNIILFVAWVFLLFNENNGMLPILKEEEQRYIKLPNSVITGPMEYIWGNISFADFTITDNADLTDYYEGHQFIGENERIFSLNLSFALPGKSIERECDFAYRDWHIMAFGEPDEAKKAFQDEGIDYFFISIDPDKQIVKGALPFSPLFHPDNLQDNFDVIWKSEQTCLLTWKGTNLNTIPWDQQFLKDYRIKLRRQGNKELYDRVQFYYQKYGTNYPVYPDLSLPPVAGFNQKDHDN